MPTLYQNGSYNDAGCSQGPIAGWANARDATSANSTSHNMAYINYGAAAFKFSGRGATQYRVHRSFFRFDTSSITSTLSAATLKIYFFSDQGNGNIIVVKSDAFTGTGGTIDFVGADYNNLDFSTPYSSEIDTTSTGLTSITLNATALADIKNNDEFIFAIINYDHDYSDSAPTSTNNFVGIRYGGYSGTSSDPQIDYTVAVVTGYPNKVNFVDSADIAKVNFVASADIEKINGV